MAKPTVSHTALGAATCRLIEQYQPVQSRLFNDPVVKDLVGAPIQVMMRFAAMRSFTIQQTDAIAAGIFGAQVCRTRYIDGVVEEAFAHGIAQLVILGAGLDTRAYRLPGVERVNVFEVDLPTAQKNKRQRLEKSLGRIPERVSFIPIDFDTQSLEEVFKGSAYDPSRPAVFVWEGVTQYITEKAVRQTLTFVSHTVPGTILVFTYVLKSIIERRSDIPGAEQLMDRVASDSPWIFGLDPSEIPAFLQPYHLNVTAEVGNSYYQEHYLKPLGRRLVVSEGERIVRAVVA